MNKAYKYRIYPNKEQEILINKTIGASRFIYNKLLGDKQDYYRKHKQTLYKKPKEYKSDYPWLKEVDSLALSHAWSNLETAYQRFFKKQSRFPKFKSKKKSRLSYQTNNQKGTVKIEGNLIRLPKLGFLKIKYHRCIPENATIKTVTVSKTKTNKYYVSLSFQYENQILKSISKKENVLGLDYSMTNLYVDSNGNIPNFPNFDELSQKKLTRASCRLARRKKGSNRRNKERLKIARIHEKIHNQKQDFLHKLSLHLANSYDCIAVETISLKEMAKKKKGKKFSFGKSVHKNSYGEFVRMLEYKLSWNGRSLYKADKWFASSQICNNCKTKNPDVKSLDVRTWICPICGMSHDRDINAARNIRDEAIKQLKIT